MECATGEPSAESLALLHSRVKPPPNPSECTFLAPLNYQVDLMNSERLGNFAGKLYCYRSKDEGCKRLLHSMSSLQPQLYLKESCPVMFTRNLNEKIANGTRLV